MKGFHKFNMNQQVKVRLLPKGMIHLLERHKRIVGSYSKYVPILDSKGYYSTQLWSLIAEFGDVLTMTNHDYFEIDIFIQEAIDLQEAG